MELVKYEEMNTRYYVCVCILSFVIRHAMRMRRITLSLVACMAVPDFVRILINGTTFGKSF